MSCVILFFSSDTDCNLCVLYLAYFIIISSLAYDAVIAFFFVPGFPGYGWMLKRIEKRAKEQEDKQRNGVTNDAEVSKQSKLHIGE